jgi:hypothetical protein
MRILDKIWLHEWRPRDGLQFLRSEITLKRLNAHGQAAALGRFPYFLFAGNATRFAA